jgi:hypothetical protein
MKGIPVRGVVAGARAILIAAALVPIGAHAQPGPASPNQPDMAIDAPARRSIVETLASQFDSLYVFPDKGRAGAAEIRKRLEAGRYDRITSATELADSLTAHLRAGNSDLHICVWYRSDAIPPMQSDGEPAEEERRRMEERERYTNYGFERVERLAGNVGYLELRSFSQDTEGLKTASAAMNFLANTDALIIDLRRNGGGSPSMIGLLLTYLTPEGSREHLNDFYWRPTDTIEQFWTLPFVPGPRLAGKPLYLLTSGGTFSAAEEFSYNVQNMKLGTLVGEVTGGGAHPVSFVRLHEHFMAMIPSGRAISPVTGTNWEGVGVKPDMQVSAEEALRAAHVAAIERLAADPNNSPARRDILAMALEKAKSTPVAPMEGFGPIGSVTGAKKSTN